MHDDEQHPLNATRDARLQREWAHAARREDAEARSGAALATFMAKRLDARPRLSRPARVEPPEEATGLARWIRARLDVQRAHGVAILRAMTDTDNDSNSDSNDSDRKGDTSR